MRKLKMLTLSLALITALLSVSFSIAATPSVNLFHDTLPGYRLINTYDETSDTVVCDIYVVGGYGNNGQIGLYYDTEYLTLAINSNGNIITDYEEYMINKKLSIKHFVKGFSCEITAETNKLDKLLNEEKGEMYFAWYSSEISYLDALENDEKIATVTFKVNPGYTVDDLKNSETGLISIATDVPSETSVIGYSAGAYCANERNTAIKNSGNSLYDLAIYTEYRGIDIEDYSNCEFKDNKPGIKLITLPDGTRALTGVSKGAQVKVLKSMFFLHSNESIEIYDPDGETPAESVSHGSIVKITDKNTTEEIPIVLCDVNSDGITDLYDLNLLMRLARGDVDKDAGISIYTVDSDLNGKLSAVEYLEFVDLIMRNAGVK